MLSDWEIKARAHRCSRTDRPFVEGDTILTLLFRDKEGFRREDVLEGIWHQTEAGAEPFSFWKSCYRTPPAKPPEAVTHGSAEGLLRRLLQEERPQQINARYILAVMLERKRVLRQVDARESDEGRILVYEWVRTGEVFLIADPQLRWGDIEAVQTEVGRLLAEGTANARPEP
ncbi:MAG TPA: hypothetical protein VGD78_10010 [Chthoniobacterales bacterium]